MIFFILEFRSKIQRLKEQADDKEEYKRLMAQEL